MFGLAGGPTVRLAPDGLGRQAVVGFEPDGSVALVSTDGRIRIDPATGAPVGDEPHDPDGPRPRFYTAASADGARLVSTQWWRRWLRLSCWDAAAGGWERRWFAEHWAELCAPAVSPAGDRVAFFAEADLPTGTDYQLLVLDADTGDPVGAGGFPYFPEHGPRFRPDGRQLVVPHEMLLVVWDARRLGKPMLVKNDSRRHFTAAAYHPSGRYLFTTSNDATVTVWDTDAWTRVKRFDWAIGRLRSVAVSPDGLLAAAGSDRGKVVVWDVDL